MSKYYDGSEKDSEPKKGTTKNTGKKLSEGLGALAGLAALLFGGSIAKKINNKA